MLVKLFIQYEIDTVLHKTFNFIVINILISALFK